jgi:hypothetical protein
MTHVRLDRAILAAREVQEATRSERAYASRRWLKAREHDDHYAAEMERLSLIQAALAENRIDPDASSQVA